MSARFLQDLRIAMKNVKNGLRRTQKFHYVGIQGRNLACHQQCAQKLIFKEGRGQGARFRRARLLPTAWKLQEEFGIWRNHCAEPCTLKTTTNSGKTLQDTTANRIHKLAKQELRQNRPPHGLEYTGPNTAVKLRDPVQGLQHQQSTMMSKQAPLPKKT